MVNHANSFCEVCKDLCPVEYCDYCEQWLCSECSGNFPQEDYCSSCWQDKLDNDKSEYMYKVVLTEEEIRLSRDALLFRSDTNNSLYRKLKYGKYEYEFNDYEMMLIGEGASFIKWENYTAMKLYDKLSEIRRNKK